ncbi:hypothetical protein MCOR27_006650 [Pyricularia oryzae]|uniref:Tyrosine specific protein phosphatases domain-containing protein n=2 Tax=Pyricularia TaxID=48558 RepID=A0ABQ8NB78_PYRGI|nr:hypothetical protein MCOR01_009882 [Pyricularia oryzae]KAI6293868.1 hypothetical protein MCOR33_008826 [Pyricularia grisea]KAI6263233.1 hypothetical protein MCOR19_000559 [Pyricularia oryzae]KAI6276068.1 hypothetical protein MCOR27_006650 [Pyricularia oryzae]KAI6276388.1 hypothetical protein MCOR26_005659 [Pyricularia oryzae]
MTASSPPAPKPTAAGGPPAELTPPFHHIPGLPNFRDIGGYAAAAAADAADASGQQQQQQHGQKLFRRNLVFRASEPSKLTDEGVAKLQELGITHVFDLRSADEVKSREGWVGSKIREWDGAQRVFAPVFTEEDYSPEAIARRWGQFSEGDTGFVLAYERILEVGAHADHPYAPFRTILAHLASEEEPTPILVHCSAGKDRTGIICALLLSLAGVEDEVIAHEYNLTEVGLSQRKQEFVEALIKAGPLKGQRDKAERMVSARKEAMRATLTMLRAKYGSVERYATEVCGMSAEALQRLRKNILVEAGSSGEQPLDWKKHAEYVAALPGNTEA